MPKRPQWRAIKIHRSYTMEEAALKLGVAKGTVGRWLKSGKLPAITDRRPFLIQGQDLIDFGKRGKASKPKCRLHECYCFTCRTIREPAERMADLIPVSTKIGDLQALCGTCGGIMHKLVSLGQTEDLSALLDLTIRQAPSRIEKCDEPSLNDHL